MKTILLISLLLLLPLAGFADSAIDTTPLDTSTTGLAAGVESPSPVAPAAASMTLVARANAPVSLAGLPSYSASMVVPAVTPTKPQTPHTFFDRTNLVGFSVHAAIRAADAAQTCAKMRNGVHEAWLPMKGCAGIAVYSMSMVPAQIGTSYIMHRAGHHRLEKWMPYLWAAPSAAGIAVSMRAW